MPFSSHLSESELELGWPRGLSCGLANPRTRKASSLLQAAHAQPAPSWTESTGSISGPFTRDPCSLFWLARLSTGRPEIRVNSWLRLRPGNSRQPPARSAGLAHLDKHLNGLATSPGLLFTSQTANRAGRLILKWASLAKRAREPGSPVGVAANGIIIVIESNHTTAWAPRSQVSVEPGAGCLADG